MSPAALDPSAASEPSRHQNCHRWSGTRFRQLWALCCLAPQDSERKGFMNKLYAIQDVCISVQNALDEVASYGERIKNTFNWTVPFLSWLAIAALFVGTLVIYFIPLRYIVQYQELKLDPGSSPNKRKKNNPG
ncbi:hypothetical protein JZ751_011680 [Albula glossodonta]|uniref:Uncharacterized protein n=1 Tax=Albula glossodonta TaxID=121402 RepID=A0A8T2PQB2_9TELE|nr:hypothetical protein JZ751_011680 [Albula glossodonta]